MLRLLTPEDADAFYQALSESQEAIAQFEGHLLKEYPNLGAVRDHLTTAHDDLPMFGIWRDGIFSGCISLRLLSDNDASIGIWLRTSAAGHGLATTASRALINCAFSAGFTSVSAAVDVRNAKSCRLWERLGFKARYATENEDGIYLHYLLTHPQTLY